MWKRTKETRAESPCCDDALDKLLRGMAAGREQALEQFYDCAVSRAYAFVLRIVRDPQLAEEVVEDAFFQTWREAARFDPVRGKPLAWLYTICRSRALDALRKREDHETYVDPIEFEARIGDDENDPYRLLDAMQRSSGVHAALSSLSPQARQLVALAFFRGLSHSEIAAFSRLPLGTVKTTINRACEKMRGHLAAQAGVTS
jgi:RNA polymerase sigma-70 factor (ECF subfamily)